MFSMYVALVAMGNSATGELAGDAAQRAFEAMAPIYDDFTAHYEYEFWTAQLLAVLERDGLIGRRLLDVACGTGKSFLPMLARGWEVTGYDISASMLELARSKVGGSTRLEIADMREMPSFGEFDLVWALDDAINYLLSDKELECALSGMRENLASKGLLLFDVNELPLYRTLCADSIAVERDGRQLVWQAEQAVEPAAGSTFDFSCFETAFPTDRDRDTRQEANVSLHRQRHFSETEVLTAIDQAGLDCLNVYGQSTDGIPRQPLDNLLHTKAIYVARAA
jgi:SAM-dependent methyltransferase